MKQVQTNALLDSTTIIWTWHVQWFFEIFHIKYAAYYIRPGTQYTKLSVNIRMDRATVTFDFYPVLSAFKLWKNGP